MTSLAKLPGSRLPLDRARRAERYAAGRWCADHSSRAGARWCMHAIPDGWEGAHVGATAAGTVHLAGIRRCASPWACAYDAPAIAERRAGEIDAGVTAWRAGGGSVLFVTATVAHELGVELVEQLELVQGSWSASFRFRAPYYSKRTGLLTNGEHCRPAWYAGQIRAVEITHGRAGWHGHIHAAIFVEAGGALEAAAWVNERRWTWAAQVNDRGGHTRVTPVLDKVTGELVIPGWDVRDVHDVAGLGSYLNKVEGGWGVGLEIARADAKIANGKGRTPWQLLALAVAGDKRAALLWDEYERATAGRRRIVWSPGLAARCGVQVVEDEEAVETAPDEPLTVVAVVPQRSWGRLVRSGEMSRFLDVVSEMATGERDWWPYPEVWLRSRPPRRLVADTG